MVVVGMAAQTSYIVLQYLYDHLEIFLNLRWNLLEKLCSRIHGLQYLHNNNTIGHLNVIPHVSKWCRLTKNTLSKCVINVIWATLINYSRVKVWHRVQRMTSQQLMFNDVELLCAYEFISLVLLLDWTHFEDQLHKVSP